MKTSNWNMMALRKGQTNHQTSEQQDIFHTFVAPPLSQFKEVSKLEENAILLILSTAKREMPWRWQQ